MITEKLKSLISKLIEYIVSLFCAALGLRSANEWSVRIASRLNTITYSVADTHRYLFNVPNPLLLWRAKTLFSKEPETIIWLQSFNSDDIFYDIGANIGVYSIYAGFRCRKVYAFEPEGSNFAVLNKNILINKLQNKVTAYPIAISDERKLDTLRLGDIQPGSAHHCFGNNVDFKGDMFKPRFEQGCLSVTLDDLILTYGLEFPSFIKIDVDGLEEKIISGGQTVISDKRLKGILVEVNESRPEDMAIIGFLEANGFFIREKGSLIEDSSGKVKVRNYIFERNTG